MSVLRFLLGWLSRPFRDEHGDAMLTTVEDHWRAAKPQLGAWGRLTFWMRQWTAVIRLIIELEVQALGASEERRALWILGVGADVKHSLRALLNRPGFTAVAVLTLGLGVGATTTMFSAVNAVLLRPLPFAGAESVLVLEQVDTRDGTSSGGLSAANARDIAGSTRSLSHVAIAENHGLRLTQDGRAVSVRTWLVSNGFMEAAGAGLHLGRGFLPDEFTEGRDRVVLLSHESWLTRFGADSAVIGRRLVLDGLEHTVVGVLQPGFAYPSAAGFWGPRPERSWDDERRGSAQLHTVARLAPGVDRSAAQLELNGLARGLAASHPVANANLAVRATPLREHLFGDIRTPLLLLLAAVALVLAVASANVAGLQLARSAGRAHEYALRSALGANTGHVLRLVGVESVLLGLGGAVLGVLLAHFGVGLVRTLDPAHLPNIQGLSLDLTVLCFSVGIAVVSAVAAGLLPAVRAARVGPQTALSQGSSRTSGGLRAGSARDRLVMGEIAVALLLTVAAGLLVRSFDRLMGEDLGFEPEGRLAVQVFSFDADHRPSLDFFPRAVDALRALPGVEAVGLTSALPLADDESILSRAVPTPVATEDPGGTRPTEERLAHLSAIDSGYATAMGIQVLTGRMFDSRERAESRKVAMVNETFARRHLPAADPVGQSVDLAWRDAGALEVVGVLADVRPRGYESDPRPEIFVSLSQFPTNGLTFVLKTRTDPGAMTQAVRESLWEVDARQAVWAARPVAELLGGWVRQRRFNTALLTVFSGLAISLAAIGVYGLMAFSVEQRLREMGIRRALGGGVMDIMAMVMKRASALALIGVGVGLAASLAVAWLLRGLLYGIKPFDWPTFLVVATCMFGVALAAAYLPARRATKVHPMMALRGE